MKFKKWFNENQQMTWQKSNEYEASSKGIYDSENTRFREYHLGGDPRNGMLTVDLNKNGYQIRNVFVDKPLQRQKFASSLYSTLNAESLAKTGKPLRSSEIGYAKKTGPTSLSRDGIKLWEKLVSDGVAVKFPDHYEFKS
jgi:hypothetical protein